MAVANSPALTVEGLTVALVEGSGSQKVLRRISAAAEFSQLHVDSCRFTSGMPVTVSGMPVTVPEIPFVCIQYPQSVHYFV